MKHHHLLYFFLFYINQIIAGNQPITMAPDIPASMTFAGEHIDLTRYDMRERFDREQLAYMYMHSNSLQIIKRANLYFPIIEPILQKNGLPDDFKYLAVVESNLQPLAFSPAKAAGLWQFMATTAREYGLEVNEYIDERYHTEKATIAACQYLKDAYHKHNNSWCTAAAAYNAGSGRITTEQDKQQVQEAFDMLLASETSRYVFRILAAKRFLEYPKSFGFHLKREHLYHTIRTREITINTSVPDWTVWAQKHGITYAQLKYFNPWLRGRSLPNPKGKLYNIRLPLTEDLHFNLKKVHVHNINWVE